jgi:predicted regulator of Ras-like GTPase activity (Roadblock/LC7/MglB family)
MSDEGQLAPLLLRAIEELWSGSLDVRRGDQPLGQIVFCCGKIAWATCRGQSETLGVFLWRLGRITRDQLAQVQQIFKEHKGQKKLGAILEETGMLSRAVLRRCLLLHTRSAVEGLLAWPDACATMSLSAPRTDEKILFGAQEVLPQGFSADMITEWRCDSTAPRTWQRLTDTVVLQRFIDLPGHLASAVVSAEGDLLAANVARGTPNLSLLSVFAAALLEASAGAASASALGPVGLLALDCADGRLLVRWLDDARRELLMMLVDNGADLGSPRAVIDDATPSIISWLRGAQRRAGTSSATPSSLSAAIRSAVPAPVVEPLPPTDGSLASAAEEWERTPASLPPLPSDPRKK